MLDVLQTVKDEVLTKGLIQNLKDFVTSVAVAGGGIVFVCNTTRAERRLMTIHPRADNDAELAMAAKEMIKAVAETCEADAIISIVSNETIGEQVCLTVTVETRLNRYSVVYPYERMRSGAVRWRDPIEMDLDVRYADALPVPATMAQA